MEVLLIKDVPKLGRAGDIVRVADGYARNYLLPRGLGKTLSEGARREAEALSYARRRREEKAALEARALASKLNRAEVIIPRKAGEKGKLYGSVTSADLAEAIATRYGISLDRRKIELEQPIRELGRHEVQVDFGHGSKATIVVKVVQEG